MCVYKTVNKTIRQTQHWDKHTVPWVPWQIFLSDERSMLGMPSDLKLLKVEIGGKSIYMKRSKLGLAKAWSSWKLNSEVCLRNTDLMISLRSLECSFIMWHVIIVDTIHQASVWGHSFVCFSLFFSLGKVQSTHLLDGHKVNSSRPYKKKKSPLGLSHA